MIPATNDVDKLKKLYFSKLESSLKFLEDERIEVRNYVIVSGIAGDYRFFIHIASR